MNTIYSKHIFLFPFRWDVKKGNVFENSNVAIGDYKMELKKIGWKDEEFYKDSLDHLDYNEFQYFYPFVRDALFDFSQKNENIIRHLEYDTNVHTDTYKIVYFSNDKEQTKILKVNHVLLNLYATGVGIISYHLWNDAYPDFQSILEINDFGRRLYPPYCSADFDLDYVRKSTIALSIEMSIGTNHFYEDFTDFLDAKNRAAIFTNEEQKLPEHVIKLLVSDNNKDISIQPILDDRMFVICWYKGEDILTKQLVYETTNHNKEFCYSFATSDDWYKYIYIDTNSASVYSKTMRYEQLKKNTYDRFVKFLYEGKPAPTLYGVSRYSFVCYSGDDFRIDKHTTTIYYKMVELCLVQRASIIHFSSIVSQLTNVLNQKGDFDKKEVKLKIDKLYRDYIRFINKFHIREITHQEQGIEIYDMLLDNMRISTHIKELDDEIAELYQYANSLEQQSQTEQANRLSFLAALFLPSTLIFSILGANFYEQDSFNFLNPIDGNAWGWIFLGLLPTLVFGFWNYKKIITLIKRK